MKKLASTFVATALLSSYATAATTSIGLESDFDSLYGINFTYQRQNAFDLELAVGGNFNKAPDVWETYPDNMFSYTAKPKNDIDTGRYVSLGSNYTHSINAHTNLSFDFGGTWYGVTHYLGRHTTLGVWNYSDDYWVNGGDENKFGAYVGASVDWKRLKAGARYDTALETILGSVAIIF